MKNKSSSSFIGKSGEYRFASELIKRGILPCWPSFDAPGFDLVAYNGERSFRIQVKTRQTHIKSKSVSGRGYIARATRAEKAVQFQMLSSTMTRHYDKRDTDLIVLYSSYFDVWYLIPINEIKVQTIRVYPTEDNCRWKKYREAWHLVEPKNPEKRIG